MSYAEDIARLDAVSRTRALEPHETDQLYEAILAERRVHLNRVRAQAAPPPPRRGGV